MNRKQKTEELHKAIFAQYRKDKKQTYKQVAKTVGCSEVLVQRVLREESRNDKEKRDKKIIKLRDEGCTQQQIAKAVGCNRQTVSIVLQKSGCYAKGFTIRKGTAYIRKNNYEGK